MKWMSSVLNELFSLFVDDGTFALAILVWLGFARWIVPRSFWLHTWSGSVLFGGCALILVESSARFSSKN